MRLFTRYLLWLLILTILVSFVIPIYFNVPYPKPLGPDFDPAARMDYRKDINEGQPGVVLLGDSILHYGIDPQDLEKRTNTPTYSISIQGSGSAVLYLVTKNEIAAAKSKPKYLVVFFRDTLLTTPDFRVLGSYMTQIDELAGSEETLLLQLAYINQMSFIEKAADQYFPLYSARRVIWQSINKHNRTLLPRSFLNCGLECTNTALTSVINKDDFENSLQGNAVQIADEQLYKPENMNFEERLPLSFLPEIVRLCNENGIQLILVRTKNTFIPDAEHERPEIQRYIQDLNHYAGENNVILLDFAYDDRLTPDLFRDAFHLKEEGKKKFTEILSESLSKLINEQR